MLISVTSMVIISQQYFLYSPAIFIPINATSIPAPTRHPPQINILISQYIIPSMTGLDISSLICATFFPVSTIQPAIVCIKVAIISKNLPQSEINTFDCIIWKRVVDAEYHINRNINASCNDDEHYNKLVADLFHFHLRFLAVICAKYSGITILIRVLVELKK